ncbi:hypothetical protein [Absidia glauca]|uniref:Uncharacterized protein n=1 Tax=Absidia glauca TaxID=4829 RepID=A0A168T5M5_ABSGL|nr:hypothetical protein [Absidia glauca]
MSILQPTAHLKGHSQPVLCVKYAKDTFLGEHALASGSEDNTCRIWDTRTQRAVKGIKGLQDPVSSVAFAPESDSSLFYLSSGKKVSLIYLSLVLLPSLTRAFFFHSLHKVLTYDLRNTAMTVSEPVREYSFSGDEINSIDINQKQTFLATADDNGEVKVIDLLNHKIHKKLTKKHGNICMSVKFSQRKAWEVWSGGLDCKVYQWDFSKGKPLNILSTSPVEATAAQMFNPPFVYTLETSLDGQWIAAGLGDASIQLLDFGGKKAKKGDPTTMRLDDGHSNMVNCLSFLPSQSESSSQLISGSVNGSLALWQLPQHKEQRTGSETAGAQLLEKYQLDKSIGRLNQLETYSMDGQKTLLAAAAVGGLHNDGGVLNIYSLA